MDFGIDYRGYCSDIARTAYFLKDGETKAPKEIQEKFDAAHEAITRASKAVHPGVIGYEVDKVTGEYLLSVGMPEITHNRASVGGSLNMTEEQCLRASLGAIWKRSLRNHRRKYGIDIGTYHFE